MNCSFWHVHFASKLSIYYDGFWCSIEASKMSFYLSFLIYVFLFYSFFHSYIKFMILLVFYFFFWFLNKYWNENVFFFMNRYIMAWQPEINLFAVIRIYFCIEIKMKRMRCCMWTGKCNGKLIWFNCSIRSFTVSLILLLFFSSLFDYITQAKEKKNILT